MSRRKLLQDKWSGPGLNRRHMDFQSIALPTELPDQPRQLMLTKQPILMARWRLSIRLVLDGWHEIAGESRPENGGFRGQKHQSTSHVDEAQAGRR